MNLAFKVDGAPNYRKVSLRDVGMTIDGIQSKNDASVYGIAMPTIDAIRNVCTLVGSGKNGNSTLLWTSLREEPVLYVNGK